MSDFTLPTNIKQIGSIGDGLRIYVEDYVCTFLHQYAEGAGYGERLAFLVGRHMVIDNQPILFIAGALHGKHTDEHEGYQRFSEKSRDYAEAMLEEHFPGMEIVGWMQSQPSYGTHLNQHYAAYHMRQFRKMYQVLFVMDPLERATAFYAADPTAITPADRMKEVSGYFIYYEKNTNMHEYMLANKSLDYTAKSATFIDVAPVTYAEEEPDNLEEPMEDDSEPRFSMSGRPRGTDPEEVIRRHRADSAKRRSFAMEHKRTINLLGSLSAVLFVVCFVLGIGFIRNQDRIERMEGEMRQLTTAYRNLFTQMNAVDLGPLSPAFAEQNLPLSEAPETPTAYLPADADPVGPVYEDTAGQSAGYPTTPEPVTDESTPEATGPATAEVLAPEAPDPLAFLPESYTIQPGDSLIAISIMFFGDDSMVNDILELNGIENPDHIVAGRTIALPRR